MPRLLHGFLGLWGPSFLGGRLKKDAFYFPHDSNAHNDPKIISLRVKGGFEAVGIFWTIVEILRESSGYKYPHDMAMLSLAISHPQSALEMPLNQCLDVGLLVTKEGFISSPALGKRMSNVDRRREILRQAGRRGNEIRWSDPQAIARRSQPNRSKVKESKVKESKDTRAEGFDAFWMGYPKKTAKEAALKAWLRLAPDEALRTKISTALAAHRKSTEWLKDGGQFIPYPATWLNQRRWEDELTTRKRPSSLLDKVMAREDREEPKREMGGLPNL